MLNRSCYQNLNTPVASSAERVFSIIQFRRHFELFFGKLSRALALLNSPRVYPNKSKGF